MNMWITCGFTGAPVYMSLHLVPQCFYVLFQHVVGRPVENKYPAGQVDEAANHFVMDSGCFVNGFLHADLVFVLKYDDQVVFASIRLAQILAEGIKVV